MTNHQVIIEAFEQMLKQGATTSLDVKEFLRKKYPNEDWYQDLVSNVLADHVEDNPTIGFTHNGIYYFLYNQPTQPAQTSQKTYSYNTGKVKIESDNWNEVVETAMRLGHDIHWSQNSQKFYSIQEMQENHLLNAVLLNLESIERSVPSFAKFLQTSPYILELIRRYPVSK